MRKVLVVDDDPSILLVLETAFEAWGYDVEQAVDGEEALRIMQSAGAPRMVILDWIMPGVTGPEVCRKIRAVSTSTPPHIIMLTAKDKSRDVLEGLYAGADDYLIKPFNPEELHARVDVASRLLELQDSLAGRVRELEEAMTKVQKLEGMLPICSYCKKIRDDKNYWQQIESYIADHANVQFTHGICPDCMRQQAKV